MNILWIIERECPEGWCPMAWSHVFTSRSAARELLRQEKINARGVNLRLRKWVRVDGHP